MDFSSLADNELLRLTLEGNLTAFEILVKRYQKNTLLYCRKIILDNDMAEDAAQNAFLKVFEKAHQFDLKRSFPAWFWRIVKNCCYDLLREKKHRQIAQDINQESDFLNDLLTKETAQTIRKIFAKMTKNYQQVLQYYYFEELNYQQISRKMKVPINTIRTWLRRAKAEFKDLYQND